MRIDFYTHTHKKQRKQLFLLATHAGDVDYKDAGAIILLENELTAALFELRNHKSHEETFVHPLLARKIPGSAKNLHREHEELAVELQDLEINFQHLKSLTSNYPKSQEQGLEFYRALNRFIASYFMHINEEEYIMQSLWEVATDAELKGMMIAFQTYDGREKGKKWLVTNLPSMSDDELKIMFRTAQLMAPEKIYDAMQQMSEEILDEKKWHLLQKYLKEK